MDNFGYTAKMTYREFLEARLANMRAEQERHKPGSADRAFWKGRELSYQDMLGCVDGAELITSTPGKTLSVEPA